MPTTPHSPRRQPAARKRSKKGKTTANCEVITDQERIAKACDGNWGSTQALIAGPTYGLNLWGFGNPAAWRIEMLVRTRHPAGSGLYFIRLSMATTNGPLAKDGAPELKLLFSLAQEWAQSVETAHV